MYSQTAIGIITDEPDDPKEVPPMIDLFCMTETVADGTDLEASGGLIPDVA